MQKSTIIVTKNNVTPIKQICVCDINTAAEPPTDETNDIDYDTFTQAEKDQFDATVAMIESKIPA